MVSAFAPIEAVATQRTARLRDVCGKEAEFAEQRPAGIAHTQATASVHDSMAAYEIYRARLKADPEGRANFEFAEQRRFIVREQRTFLENVDATLQFQARPALTDAGV